MLSSPMFLQLRFPSRLSAAPSSTTTAQKPPLYSTHFSLSRHPTTTTFPLPLLASKKVFADFFSVRTRSGGAKIRTPFSSSSSLPHSSWEAKGALQLFFLFSGGRGRDFSHTLCLLFYENLGTHPLVWKCSLKSSHVVQYVWCIVM